MGVGAGEAVLLEGLLKENALGQYGAALADLGVVYDKDLAKVTDEEIKTLLMKPIHANKLRHLRDKQVAARTAAEVAEEGDNAQLPPQPKPPPALCQAVRDSGTSLARSAEEMVGANAVNAVLKVVGGLHAAATGPEAAHLRSAASKLMDKAKRTAQDAGLPAPTLPQVPEIDVEEAKGAGWMFVKALVVALQVLSYPVWAVMEAGKAALLYCRHEIFALWSEHVMLL